MTPERFEALAEAFGGDVAAWPDAEREAAAAFMAAEPESAARVLADASDLDAAIAAYSPPRAATGLMDRIVASAPKVPVRRWIGWLVPAGMGAGLAAACAAGMVLGARLSAPAAPQEPDSIVATVGDEDVSAYFDEEA